MVFPPNCFYLLIKEKKCLKKAENFGCNFSCQHFCNKNILFSIYSIEGNFKSTFQYCLIFKAVRKIKTSPPPQFFSNLDENLKIYLVSLYGLTHLNITQIPIKHGHVWVPTCFYHGFYKGIIGK